MTLLDGPLATIFGAAFGALFRSAVLHKALKTDNGAGGFSVATTDYAVKLVADALGAADRAASGLPASAVRVTVLLAGLPAAPDLDDGLSFDGVGYRVVKVDRDPAGASARLALVPA